MGFSQHAGMVIVADGTPEAARRLARVLWNDPATGVMRHADAGYEERDRLRAGERARTCRRWADPAIRRNRIMGVKVRPAPGGGGGTAGRANEIDDESIDVGPAAGLPDDDVADLARRADGDDQPNTQSRQMETSTFLLAATSWRGSSTP